MHTSLLGLATAIAPLALNNGFTKPEMGFNTWESWGCDISEQKVHAAADAMVSKGLLAAGYRYLNLDDCWMAMERASTVIAVNETLYLNNTLQAGKNFSSGMRALGKYIHSKGLFYGIYESSGTKTCQKFAGTLGNEWIDAQT
jgi:alpha-galactosidase